MARSLRQSKILEIIKLKEIETQEELARELKSMAFDITQATVSRDIKELGLIKISTDDGKRYKYAAVENIKQPTSNKMFSVFKEMIVSVQSINNLVVIKTLKGMGGAVSTLIDKLNYEIFIGTVFGDDTVMVICSNSNNATLGCDKIMALI